MKQTTIIIIAVVASVGATLGILEGIAILNQYGFSGERGSMPDFPWDSALIATVISVAISLGILLVREKKFEPEKWKKNVRLEKITKKLEVYGRLNTLLESGTERIKRQKVGEGKKETHLIEIPLDLDKLQQIFEGSRYLLSDKLIQTYRNFVREDEYFSDVSSRKKDPTVLLCDLSEMHKIAKEEFDVIKKEYEELTK